MHPFYILIKHSWLHLLMSFVVLAYYLQHLKAQMTNNCTHHWLNSNTMPGCLEQYQKLLDEAGAKENKELGLTGPKNNIGLSTDDVR